MKMPKKTDKERRKPPPPGACLYCNSNEDNEFKFGKLIFNKKHKVRVHHYCLLFASGLCQRGEGNDENAIEGFMVQDILKEFKRGNSLRCGYCSKRNALVGCVIKKCRSSYHFGCGVDNDAIFLFYDNFISYCRKHRPQQTPPEIPPEKPMTNCPICLDPVKAEVSNETLRTPCCTNSWFHRICVQRQALSSGYFFRCGICNNKEDFQREMKEFGIYIPEKDAAWELEENAYQDLYQRHSQCDITPCLCSKGRKYNPSRGKWEIVLCDTCGSRGCHLTCGGLTNQWDDWVCDQCEEVVDRINFGKPKKSKKTSTKTTPGSGHRKERLEGKSPRTPLPSRKLIKKKKASASCPSLSPPLSELSIHLPSVSASPNDAIYLADSDQCSSSPPCLIKQSPPPPYVIDEDGGSSRMRSPHETPNKGDTSSCRKHLGLSSPPHFCCTSEDSFAHESIPPNLVVEGSEANRGKCSHSQSHACSSNYSTNSPTPSSAVKTTSRMSMRAPASHTTSFNLSALAKPGTRIHLCARHRQQVQSWNIPAISTASDDSSSESEDDIDFGPVLLSPDGKVSSKGAPYSGHLPNGIKSIEDVTNGKAVVQLKPLSNLIPVLFSSVPLGSKDHESPGNIASGLSKGPSSNSPGKLGVKHTCSKRKLDTKEVSAPRKKLKIAKSPPPKNVENKSPVPRKLLSTMSSPQKKTTVKMTVLAQKSPSKSKVASPQLKSMKPATGKVKLNSLEKSAAVGRIQFTPTSGIFTKKTSGSHLLKIKMGNHFKAQAMKVANKATCEHKSKAGNSSGLKPIKTKKVCTCKHKKSKMHHKHHKHHKKQSSIDKYLQIWNAHSTQMKSMQSSQSATQSSIQPASPRKSPKKSTTPRKTAGNISPKKVSHSEMISRMSPSKCTGKTAVPDEIQGQTSAPVEASSKMGMKISSNQMPTKKRFIDLIHIPKEVADSMPATKKIIKLKLPLKIVADDSQSQKKSVNKSTPKKLKDQKSSLGKPQEPKASDRTPISEDIPIGKLTPKVVLVQKSTPKKPAHQKSTPKKFPIPEFDIDQTTTPKADLPSILKESHSTSKVVEDTRIATDVLDQEYIPNVAEKIIYSIVAESQESVVEKSQNPEKLASKKKSVEDKSSYKRIADSVQSQDVQSPLKRLKRKNDSEDNVPTKMSKIDAEIALSQPDETMEKDHVQKPNRSDDKLIQSIKDATLIRKNADLSTLNDLLLKTPKYKVKVMYCTKSESKLKSNSQSDEQNRLTRSAKRWNVRMHSGKIKFSKSPPKKSLVKNLETASGSRNQFTFVDREKKSLKKQSRKVETKDGECQTNSVLKTPLSKLGSEGPTRSSPRLVKEKTTSVAVSQALSLLAPMNSKIWVPCDTDVGVALAKVDKSRRKSSLDIPAVPKQLDVKDTGNNTPAKKSPKIRMEVLFADGSSTVTHRSCRLSMRQRPKPTAMSQERCFQEIQEFNKAMMESPTKSTLSSKYRHEKEDVLAVPLNDEDKDINQEEDELRLDGIISDSDDVASDTSSPDKTSDNLVRRSSRFESGTPSKGGIMVRRSRRVSHTVSYLDAFDLDDMKGDEPCDHCRQRKRRCIHWERPSASPYSSSVKKPRGRPRKLKEGLNVDVIMKKFVGNGEESVKKVPEKHGLGLDQKSDCEAVVIQENINKSDQEQKNDEEREANQEHVKEHEEEELGKDREMHQEQSKDSKTIREHSKGKITVGHTKGRQNDGSELEPDWKYRTVFQDCQKNQLTNNNNNEIKDGMNGSSNGNAAGCELTMSDFFFDSCKQLSKLDQDKIQGDSQCVIDLEDNEVEFCKIPKGSDILEINSSFNSKKAEVDAFFDSLIKSSSKESPQMLSRPKEDSVILESGRSQESPESGIILNDSKCSSEDSQGSHISTLSDIALAVHDGFNEEEDSSYKHTSGANNSAPKAVDMMSKKADSLAVDYAKNKTSVSNPNENPAQKPVDITMSKPKYYLTPYSCKVKHKHGPDCKKKHVHYPVCEKPHLHGPGSRSRRTPFKKQKRIPVHVHKPKCLAPHLHGPQPYKRKAAKETLKCDESTVQKESMELAANTVTNGDITDVQNNNVHITT